MNKPSPIQPSLKAILVFSFISMGFLFNSTVFSASELTTSNISTSSQQNADDFVEKYGVPTQIVPPAKKQQQTTSDTSTETTDTSTTTTKTTGPTPQTSQTSPTSSTAPSAQIQDSDSLQLVQPKQKPYESLHQKNVWEKLKTKPHDAPKPETNEETDEVSSSLDAQNTAKHNIYK